MVCKAKIGTVSCLVALATVGCGKRESRSESPRQESLAQPSLDEKACPSSQEAACQASEQRYHELLAARDGAAAAGESKVVAQLSLQLNYEAEKLRLLREPAADLAKDLSELDAKYRVLTRLLEEHQAKAVGQQPGGGDESPAPPASPPAPGGEDQGGIDGATTELPAIVYSEAETQAVAEVIKDYGDLYISETGMTAEGQPRWEEVLVDQPWAGYWYPLKDKSLFTGDKAPLVKLDRLAKARGTAIQSAATESQLAALAEDSWEGRCAAWAVAASLTKEPKEPRTIEGITFDLNDQKALLIKVHELYPVHTYGIRYNGDAQTDGTLQDIRPEAFHRVFLGQLRERRRPFVVDDAPGIEVWSKTIYRVRWTVQKDPEVKDAYRVTALPWLIKHRTALDPKPTSATDRAAPELVYRLYVDPSTARNGQYRVIAGEWLAGSRQAHPDTLTVPEPQGARRSGNEEINKVLDLVREIVGGGG